MDGAEHRRWVSGGRPVPSMEGARLSEGRVPSKGGAGGGAPGGGGRRAGEEEEEEEEGGRIIKIG